MNARTYRMAVFDLDGTLLDTAEGILSAIRYTATALHLPLPPHETLRSYCIGPPIELSFAKLFSLQGEALADACHTFRERYRSHELEKATIYPGVYTMLCTLRTRNILIGVATYKREEYALPLLQKFGICPYLTVACGSQQAEDTKKDILWRALNTAGVSPACAVMIGDTVNDSASALAVGCDFIGVTYGFGFKKQKNAHVHARGFADTPLDVLHFFDQERSKPCK